MDKELNLRCYRPADLPEMVRISNARSIVMGDPPGSTEARMRQRLHEYHFGFEAERDAYLAFQGEACVGYALCLLDGDHSAGYIDTCIDPAADFAAVIAPLMAAAEKHIRQNLGGDQLPGERPFFVDSFAYQHAVDERKINWLQEAGYHEVRRFYDMLILLDEKLTPPTLPDGLALRPFELATQARAYHAAYLDSFRDHWGNISIYEFSQFAKHFDNPEYDESLWFAAWDGEEIAGLMFGETSRNYKQRAVVELLGVRRPWRRRGLGMALLRQAFYLFHQKGFTEAELGVDAESRTNAVALYERAGMHTHRVELILRKMIWGRPEEIVE